MAKGGVYAGFARAQGRREILKQDLEREQAQVAE
jgi:hypothetical protein